MAVAGRLHNLRLLPCSWLHPVHYLTFKYFSSRASPPLSLFVCAVDEESDQAGAALVTALKQLSGRDVELHGVVSFCFVFIVRPFMAYIY